jgi:hypothetical protein
MVVDPATDAVDYYAVGPRPISAMIYASATGKLYGVPDGSNAVVILDPDTNVTDVTTMTGFGAPDLAWGDAVYAPVNDKICEFCVCNSTYKLRHSPELRPSAIEPCLAEQCAASISQGTIQSTVIVIMCCSHMCLCLTVPFYIHGIYPRL